MALIQKSKGRRDGGYTRLFGNDNLGLLLSKVQATVISSGTELEKEVITRSNQVQDMNAFLENCVSIENGVYLASKKAVKHSIAATDQEPDLLIFKITPTKKHCYIIELKDGDAFDTKKAQGEKNSLVAFQHHVSSLLPFTTSVHICSFNAVSREEVVKGFKHKISVQEAMTGKELCELLEIDYADILAKRQIDQLANLRFFLDQLLEIEEVHTYLKEKAPLGDD